ncbi:MAG TPA: hypothetical protein PLO37_24215 [Candidatus Hydrogenedentes bacterium]|nr:hypothetical protein [Candidatus Hydrogenedentota bacterium]HPG69969.1 hypothetical protein [Candidatus Hydrogenedentota bacterium]
MTAPVRQRIEHAEAKMLQADFADREGRAILLAEAKDALLTAEHAAPGAGAWLLACIASAQEQENLCRKWLDRAKKLGTLPPRTKLLEHHYLEAVRERKWFRALVAAAPAPE